MLAQDGYGIQRRDLDVEDYIDIARRHKAWIMGPAFAGLIISVVGAFLWPDTYISSASIKVVPQQVPTNYVQANVNQLMQDRISSLAQSILSRNMLTSLINTLQLYPKEMARKPMDDVVDDMRRDIKIGGIGTMAVGASSAVPAFQISFAYTDRYKAQRVVQELASRFIDENFRNRTRDSLMTNQLLRDNWDTAKKDLEATEMKVAEFRGRNSGRLPDQMSMNLQQMNALQARTTSLNESISRINQERLMMEGLLRIYKDEMSAAKQPLTIERSAERKNERLAETDREIRKLEDVLGMQRERYKDSHPDIQQTMTLLAAAKKKRETILQAEDSTKKTVAEDSAPIQVIAPGAAKEARNLEANYRRIETQISAKNMEAEDIRKELDQVNSQMRAYETRMQGTPLSDKEYSDLLREQELAKEKFGDIDAKMTRSSMAQQMEDRRQGENLEPLDSASLPMTPAKPKRLMVVGIGTGIGLFLGVIMAGAREVRDTSLKNLKDVRAYTQISVLGSIPLLENDLVIKRRRRLAWLGWSLACLAGIAIMSGSIIYYYATKV
jgi:succinoglycan biosynthesis transport protein ExoP